MSRVGLLVSLALTACASAPGYKAPLVAVPATFRETRDTIIQTPAPGSAIADTGAGPALDDSTLTRLIREALRANLDVRTA